MSCFHFYNQVSLFIKISFYTLPKFSVNWKLKLRQKSKNLSYCNIVLVKCDFSYLLLVLPGQGNCWYALSLCSNERELKSSLTEQVMYRYLSGLDLQHVQLCWEIGYIFTKSKEVAISSWDPPLTVYNTKVWFLLFNVRWGKWYFSSNVENCLIPCRSAASNILLYLTDAKFTKYLKLCTHPASFLRE